MNFTSVSRPHLLFLGIQTATLNDRQKIRFLPTHEGPIPVLSEILTSRLPHQFLDSTDSRYLPVSSTNTTTNHPS